MKRCHPELAGLIALCASAPVWAAEPSPWRDEVPFEHVVAEPESEPLAVLLPRVDSAAWLTLQRSGDAASAHSQRLSGEAMDRAYKRYLKSFEAPIPPRFPRESASADGGGK